MDNKILIRSESFRNAFEAINSRLVKKYSNYLNFKIKKKFFYTCVYFYRTLLLEMNFVLKMATTIQPLKTMI